MAKRSARAAGVRFRVKKKIEALNSLSLLGTVVFSCTSSDLNARCSFCFSALLIPPP